MGYTWQPLFIALNAPVLVRSLTLSNVERHYIAKIKLVHKQNLSTRSSNWSYNTIQIEVTTQTKCIKVYPIVQIEVTVFSNVKYYKAKLKSHSVKIEVPTQKKIKVVISSSKLKFPHMKNWSITSLPHKKNKVY